MKRVTNYLMMFMMAATVLFVTSCGEDTENPTPNTAVSFADTTTIVAAPGDTVDFVVNGIGTENIRVVANPNVTFVGSNEVTPGTEVEVVIPITTAPGTSIELTASATDATASAQRTIFVAYADLIDALTDDNAERFSILAAAVQEAGLLNTIRDADALTIFAPTNEAFEAIGIDENTDLSTVPNLASILQYHVITGEVLAGAVSEDGQDVPTLLTDQSLYAVRDGDEVRINGVQVTDADIISGNGVVHVVGKVLFPLTWEAVLLAPPTTDQTSKTFFSTRTGQTYSVNDVTNAQAIISPFIDFGYGWGPQNGASFESPDSYTRYNLESEGWSTLNNTDFRMTSDFGPADFDAVNPAITSDISAEYEAGTAPTNTGQITGLEVDDVVAFTVGDRFGLIKVLEIEPGFESNDFIRIEVKVTN